MTVDSIRIGYVDVPVCLEDLQEGDCFGYFEEHPSPKICLHNDMSPLYTAGTGIHEVIEAISAIYGLELSENQVRTLETAIVSIVKDNPGSVDRWFKAILT